MNKFFLLCLVAFILIPHHSAGEELTAEAILARLDDNMVFETAYAEIEMLITIGRRVRISS